MYHSTKSFTAYGHQNNQKHKDILKNVSNQTVNGPIDFHCRLGIYWNMEYMEYIGKYYGSQWVHLTV